ncbi:hypothetical protein MIND_00580600 [Mycena indigotica]|uniref:AB hydrolase-1 domain-containing protein n=1 Tax=Mycena indigotica TaxID=2126181 RepID=A0A8H6SPA9_9AGAR|nr:uncharacterized protein MIND_00580600 [Mycena indigotica]KAF7303515.1 hypothetical protein MIND_00580600 [Mycena indigotica]
MASWTSTVHTLAPSARCPFHVAAVQYVPAAAPGKDGLTLVFLHATNTHKESYEPVLRHLLDRISVRDVWCIENPNHGASAVKNRELLESAEYRETWSAAEYTRAAHAFLTATEHGVDFRARTLVGLAHSAASAPLLMLQRAAPAVPFAGLVFMDAAILPVGTRATQALCALFGNWAKSKPHTWPDLAAARRNLAATAFRGWDPRAIDLFVQHAIRPVDELDEGKKGVTLACSTKQEAAYYLAPGADLVAGPTQVFDALTAADATPLHAIICLNDEYRGMGTEMKTYQIERVRRMRNGSVQIIEGGHMFPQINPRGTARAIENALEKIQARLRGAAPLSRL